MLRKPFAFAVLCLGLAAAAAHAESVLRWRLDVAPDAGKRNPAGRVELETKKHGRQVFWYVVYTATNTHDEAVPLALAIEATTDVTDEAVGQTYRPAAMKWIRERFGDDVQSMTQLAGRTLEPGETVRAAAVFQFRRDDDPKKFEERMDRVEVHVRGFIDPVKRDGLETSKEVRELVMHFEKRGDEIDPGREPVRFLRSEEHVVE